MVTEEFKQDIRNFYKQKGAKFFVKKYGMPINRVYSWANFLKASKQKDTLEREKDKVIKMYFQEKKTIKQIKEMLKIGKSSIIKILKNNGGGRCREDMHLNKIELNESFFEEINTPEKAYWFGFIAADGNIYKNRLQIGLADKDFSHLEKFCKRINYNGKIHKDIHGSKLVITRRKLIDDLKRLGLMANKSLILDEAIFNHIPDKFLSAFMLGYFDGDGSFSKTKYNVEFSLLGNEPFLTRYSENLLKFGIKCSLPKKDKRTKQTYYIRTSVKKQLDAFKNAFYLGENKSEDFLQRKKEKIIQNDRKFTEI